MKAAALTIALVACAARAPEPLSNRTLPAAAQPAPDAPPAPGVGATLARLERFSDEMCGCPDRDCADRVVDDMSRWVHDLASAGAANPHVDVLQSARAQAAAHRVSRCMAVVYARRARPAAAP